MNLYRICENLHQAAASSLTSPIDGGFGRSVPAGPTPQQQQQVEQLGQLLQNFHMAFMCIGSFEDAADSSPLLLARLHADALPLAAIAGELVLAAQPQDSPQAQQELAQAAATRSCAYLRCANLSCEGGCAAGQGAGSKRCSACRSVYYCGPACSHADWRQGGHNSVCKPLAALRQQARAGAACGSAFCLIHFHLCSLHC